MADGSKGLRHHASPAPLWLLGLVAAFMARWPAPWRALLEVGHVPVADALPDGDHRPGVLVTDTLSSRLLFLANAVAFLIDDARFTRTEPPTKTAARWKRTAATRRCCGGLQLCGVGGGGGVAGRARRSAMN